MGISHNKMNKWHMACLVFGATCILVAGLFVNSFLRSQHEAVKEGIKEYESSLVKDDESDG